MNCALLQKTGVVYFFTVREFVFFEWLCPGFIIDISFSVT